MARIGGELGTEARRAAERSAVYAATPSTTHLDHLGRAFLLKERNRWVDPETEETSPETRAVLDVEGNVLRVVDARRNVAQENTYGPGGVTLRTQSVDAGSRWALAAVDGTPLRSWNSRGVRTWGRFDALRRPTHSFVRESEESARLVTRAVYGESLPNPEATNHRGRAYRVYDGAGAVTHEAYDFEGNLLRQTRRLAAAYEETVDWSALAELQDVTDLEVAAAEFVEEEAFETAGAFDALGRPVSQRSPDGTLLRYGYNDAALLESVTGRVRGANAETTFVSNVDYNARGQRTLVAYGNGTQTAYTYDPQTFRLERLRTQGGGQTFQDLRYWFDAAGNIVEQQDGAQQATVFAGEVVEPHQRFAYDAQSRLGWASGREHRSLSQPTHESFGSVAHREDGAAMRRYTQRYVYDVVGNILRMQHAADGGDWTRRYVYEEDGNRLVANSGPEDAADQHSHTYGYDVHGNMTSMPHLSEVQWDFADRMQSADLGGGGTAYFVYDAGGERVRKVRVNEGGGRSFERIYIGGFEVYRERVGGTVRLARETVHVGDDAGRMCLLETRTVRDGEAVAEPQTVQRYQYGNHLGSAALELTEDREVISYEEYHPYGTSSYRAANSGVDVSERRYRYTGKERDEETGLGYHGARYYACWLGRWTASDPIGLGDGVNRYRYARNSPVVLNDLNGMLPPDGPSMDRFVLRNSPQHIQGGAINAVNEQTDAAADGIFEAPRRAWEALGAVVRENVRFFEELDEYDPVEEVAETLDDPAANAPAYLEPAVGDEVRALVEGQDALTEVYQASIDGHEVSPETRSKAAKGLLTAFLAGLSAEGVSSQSNGGVPSAKEMAARTKRGGTRRSSPPEKSAPNRKQKSGKGEDATTPETAGGRPSPTTSVAAGGGGLKPHPADRPDLPGGHRGRYQAAAHYEGIERLPADWDVHHSIPQELRGDPRIAGIDIDSPANLRGIRGSRSAPAGPTRNVHQQITNEWADFLSKNPSATREQILGFRDQIDYKYGFAFWENQQRALR